MLKEKLKYMFLSSSIMFFLVFIGCLVWFGIYLNHKINYKIWQGTNNEKIKKVSKSEQEYFKKLRKLFLEKEKKELINKSKEFAEELKDNPTKAISLQKEIKKIKDKMKNLQNTLGKKITKYFNKHVIVSAVLWSTSLLSSVILFYFFWKEKKNNNKIKK